MSVDSISPLYLLLAGLIPNEYRGSAPDLGQVEDGTDGEGGNLHHTRALYQPAARRPVMQRLTLLAGALLASVFATGIARPPDLNLGGNSHTATALPSDSTVLAALPVTDRTGTASGRVVEVLRLPDDSVSALEIAWTGPDGRSGISIEHPVQFLDFRPEAPGIVARQSWNELLTGYSAALSAPDPAPPRAGSA